MQNFVHTYWTNGTIGITWKYFQNDVFGRRSVVSMHKRFTIKELPNGFPCLDTLIQILGMLLVDFRKAENSRLEARVFLRFSQVSQHPACLDKKYPNTENH